MVGTAGVETAAQVVAAATGQGAGAGTEANGEVQGPGASWGGEEVS